MPMKCGNCGGEGHNKRYCPSNESNSRPMGPYNILELGLLNEGDSVTKVDSNLRIHVRRKNGDYDVITIVQMDEEENWGLNEEIRIMRITKGNYTDYSEGKENFNPISENAKKVADEIMNDG